MRIVLASGSETRRGIMDSLTIKYDVIKSGVDETCNIEDPNLYVEELSRRKAKDVSAKVGKGDYIILAADTIIYKDGKKYEKPKSIEEAFKNLKELSGSTNIAVTGVTLIDNRLDNIVTFSDITKVSFKDISDEDLKFYIDHHPDILYNAGYTLEGIMSLFLEKLDGDFYNVLGLPLGKIYTMLNKMGYSLKDLD